MKHAIRPLIAFLLCMLAMSALADVVVVTRRDSPLHELSAKQVSDLYLGRIRGLPDGQAVIVIDRALDSNLRRHFFQLLNGMSLKQINAYWARLQFSGQVLPPPRFPDAGALIKTIQSSPAAIGYLDPAEVDDSVRVLLHLRDAS